MPHLVDYNFTAAMEAQLDAISRGETDAGHYLRAFYTDGFADLGNGAEVKGLTPLLAEVRDRIDPAKASALMIGHNEGTPVHVRIGRYGTFVKVGDETASVAEDQAPDELTVARAMELIEERRKGNAPLGVDSDDNEIFMRNGRYGWYLQRGRGAHGEKPTMVSLSRGMTPEQINLDRAIAQLSLPRVLGAHPTDSQDVTAHVGRYGDYIKWGDETRTLTEGIFAINATLDKAVELLATPRKRGRQMIRELGKRAEDGATIALWTGRWGPYVTDGSTNKTLGEIDPETLPLARAIELIKAATEAKNGRLLGNDPADNAEVKLMDGRFGAYVTNGKENASLPRGVSREEVDLALALTRLRDFGKPVKKRPRRGAAAAKKTKAVKAKVAKGKAKTKAKAKRKAKRKAKPKAKSKTASAAKAD
jgi:DNA topoisomerase-1